jgi:hypothetical protein
MQRKLLWISNVQFNATGQLLTIYSALIIHLRRNGNQHFTDFKKVYDSGRREVLHNILIEFHICMKLVRLIKMCILQHITGSR